mmetsp:Transcript_28283/g.71034  ORF Transcript_28283/g.71034 Transcript_28283/m.71034 type:complete len:231 (+) Transcript_28283:334-1026(+)
MLCVRFDARGIYDAEFEVARHRPADFVRLRRVEVSNQDAHVVVPRPLPLLEDVDALLGLPRAFLRELLDVVLILEAPAGDVRAHDEGRWSRRPWPSQLQPAHGPDRQRPLDPAPSAVQDHVRRDPLCALVLDLPLRALAQVQLVAEELIVVLFGARLQGSSVGIDHFPHGLRDARLAGANHEFKANLLEDIFAGEPFLHANDIWRIWPTESLLQLVASLLLVLRVTGEVL